MKQRVLLLFFGLTLGLAVSCGVLALWFSKSDGSSFKDLTEFRRTMLENDRRDVGQTTLRSIINPHSNDNIIYDLRPNLDTNFQGVKVSTNNCGLRSPERKIEKLANVYRIALLGDSFAFGWGVDQKETFAQVLEDTLNRLSTGSPKYEVFNFGVPGYSTFQEVEKFKESGLDLKPDAVLVYFVENDFGFPFFVRDVSQSDGILSAVTFARLSWNRVDPRIEQQRRELVESNPNKAIKSLSDLCREHGIRLSVAFNPGKKWLTYYRRLPIMKQRRDIHLVALRQALLRIIETREIDPKELSLPTDPHPSPLKHKIIGELLAVHYMDTLGNDSSS